MKKLYAFCCLLLCCNAYAQAPQLSVSTRFPQYLHQGDRTELLLTIHNRGAAEVTGQVQLLLQDAATGSSADGWFQNFFPNQYFTAAAKDSTTIAFPVEVPYTFFDTMSVQAVWRTSQDSGGPKTSVFIVPQEKPTQQNLLLRGAGSYAFSPLLEADAENVRHKHLKLRLALSPAAFAYAALPLLAAQPAPPHLATAQRIFAYALAVRLWRTQPLAARSLFANNPGWEDSSFVYTALHQNIAALAAAQSPDGSWAPWPGAAPGADATAQIVLYAGWLLQLDALDEKKGQKLMAAAHKGLALLQNKSAGAPTDYLAALLKGTPKTPIPPGFYPHEFLSDQNIKLEAAALQHNQPLCDSLATVLLQQWSSVTVSAGTVYALLLAYPHKLQPPPAATVQWGGMAPQALPQNSYLPQAAVPPARIQPAAGKITFQVPKNTAVWALVSWQYATAAPEQTATQQWFVLQKGKSVALASGSTISLGDTVETVLQTNTEAARDGGWMAMGIPAGLRLLKPVFDPRQVWIEQQGAVLYAWLPAKGRNGYAVRLVAAHRGLFYSGAAYSGTGNASSGKRSGESLALTIE